MQMVEGAQDERAWPNESFGERSSGRSSTDVLHLVPRAQTGSTDLVGESRAFQDLMRQVAVVAETDSTVLLCGETGTGKELVAKAIRERSARAAGPFVKFNCAAVPAGMLESELFGHERGAFTDAVSRRVGRFELAHLGTILLDEIGELPLAIQPKLLRIIQEREFERVGGTRTLHSDTRIIAATHRDLAWMSARGSFREDLYYRLNVFPIRVPPLRERRADIPKLANHFVGNFARQMGKAIDSIDRASVDRLVHYDWPGNVRELQNVLERAVILAEGPVLRVDFDRAASPTSTLSLASSRPSSSLTSSPTSSRGTNAPSPSPPSSRTSPTSRTPRALGAPNADEAEERPHSARSERLEQVEREHILAALAATGWVVGGAYGAAARLGLKRSTLSFRMKKLGIVRPR